MNCSTTEPPASGCCESARFVMCSCHDGRKRHPQPVSSFCVAAVGCLCLCEIQWIVCSLPLRSRPQGQFLFRHVASARNLQTAGRSLFVDLTFSSTPSRCPGMWQCVRNLQMAERVSVAHFECPYPHNGAHLDLFPARPQPEWKTGKIGGVGRDCAGCQATLIKKLCGCSMFHPAFHGCLSGELVGHGALEVGG